MESKIEDFQKHHRNTFNIAFHIGCGLLYMSLLLTLMPSWVFWLYVVVILVFFPSLSVALGVGVLWVATQYIRSLRLPWTWTLLGVGIVYMLPELSHWITHEETVLQIKGLTALDIIDNFFFLYPQSILAQTRKYVSAP